MVRVVNIKSQPGDWLPISSAPKDGRRIMLLAFYHEHERTGECHMQVGRWHEDVQEWVEAWKHDVVTYVQFWRPLPVLPRGCTYPGAIIEQGPDQLVPDVIPNKRYSGRKMDL